MNSRNSQWKLRDIVVLSSLSVVFAVIYLLFLQIGNVLVGFMGPMGYEVIFGIWFIVSIIATYIIRKPGAAVISETVAGLVEVLIGNAVGPILIVSALIQGLGAEAVFAATRYRNYSTKVLMLAGVGSAVFSFAWGYFRSGYAAYSVGLIIAMFVVRCISGALISGLLGKWIADALANTGVLRSFPIAKGQR
ncbi:ECF transporter S component [Paenibacillus sp. chi10]|uniref:ECF transporter S component n=2 Tax=Paenibacillus TaxID=44249 RepID=A0AAJ2JTQ7_9BACL|nr:MULTISPECIES: ECF transporter S component [Paenibacillus]MDT8975499.1 ECF transporter S component [Paenibacillus sp. chi10]OBY77289.1 thiamine permease [Paenibacillus sp. KS1]SYX85322.1 thiamine transporter, permease component [Paenibacillus alvei]